MLPSQGFSSFCDYLQWVWSCHGSLDIDIFVTLCWQLWKARNNVVFDHGQPLSFLNCRRAMDWVKDYHKVLSLDHASIWSAREHASWNGCYQN